MNALELRNLVTRALELTGQPEWPSPDDSGERDRLIFVDAGDDEPSPIWAIEPFGSDADGFDEYLPISVPLAIDLIRARLEAWLLDRGWQVQASLRRGTVEWRLADCLWFGDGGGDRLDTDYPRSDDALGVLCQSVVAVVEHIVRPKARGPG